MLRLLLATISFLVFTSSCSRNDYLYHSNPIAGESVSTGKLKVKELLAAHVDVLWVIDNSGSMYTHQQNVVKNSELFVDEFSQRANVNWKFGVVSISYGEPNYSLPANSAGFEPGDEMLWSKPGSVDYFKKSVDKMGTNGFWSEKSFQPTLLVLEDYPNFLRANSFFVMIFISDSSEETPITSGEFMSRLKVLTPLQSGIRLYAVLATPDLGCNNGEPEGPYKGSKYEDIVNLTGGKAYPLCTPDFGKNLVDIAKDIVKKTESKVVLLKKRPIVRTIQVFYEGKSIPGGPKELGGFWTYDFEKNAVAFYDLDFAPNPEAQIEVTYEEDSGWD